MTFSLHFKGFCIGVQELSSVWILMCEPQTDISVLSTTKTDFSLFSGLASPTVVLCWRSTRGYVA